LVIAIVQFGIIYNHFEMSFRREKCKIPNCVVEQVKISQPRSIWCNTTHFSTLHTLRKMNVPTLLIVGSSWNFNNWS